MEKLKINLFVFSYLLGTYWNDMSLKVELVERWNELRETTKATVATRLEYHHQSFSLSSWLYTPGLLRDI